MKKLLLNFITPKKTSFIPDGTTALSNPKKIVGFVLEKVILLLIFLMDLQPWRTLYLYDFGVLCIYTTLAYSVFIRPWRTLYLYNLGVLCIYIQGSLSLGNIKMVGGERK